ncbi:MAG TPA: 50S ribosomal protein L4 [Phycisphaerales bacterium]|nr:50S ribosomal protein L4 [Phycisphaerales bacterium]HCD32408.1 50S ribosomal protein L4 [Phycisphaerales bacterium]|tara:strand:- start:760 stop:1422 length:663 start_codon:yes stop_codon:yes gene_type:complete
MIEIPVHDIQGKQIDTLQVDEALLGGEVRHALLKQAYVRFHANRRQGTASTRSRADTSYSTRKMYKQKGTGSARRGTAGTNIMYHGGHTFAKSVRSFRQDMPKKMRRLANRNALLAKAVDGEIKIVDSLSFEKPSTKVFSQLLSALNINRTCLVALSSTTSTEAKSARNVEHVSVTNAELLNAFDVLNHRFLLIDKATMQSVIDKAQGKVNPVSTNVEGE